MIAIIDNYDSFTFNLFQFVGAIEPDIQVFRNDAITPDELLALAPSHVVISPGPGHPREAGNCIAIVRELEGRVPILGVCLGHQAICEAYGANVTYARQLMHGKQSIAHVDVATQLFAGLGDEFPVARYHSLAVDPATLPDCLEVTAHTADGEVMAVQHVKHPTYGVQFHPESIMTLGGMQVIENFIHLGKE